MAFPTSPVNGEYYNNGEKVYKYNSTSNSWVIVNDINTEAKNLYFSLGSKGSSYVNKKNDLFTFGNEYGFLEWTTSGSQSEIVLTNGVAQYTNLLKDEIVTKSNLINNSNSESGSPMIKGELNPFVSNATWEEETTTVYQGSKSRKLTITTTGSAGYVRLVDNESTTDLHGIIPERTYKASCRVYVPSTGGPLPSEVSLRSIYYDGAWSTDNFISPSSTDTWEYIETIVSVATVATGYSLLIRIDGAASDGEYIFIDDVRLKDLDESHDISAPSITSGIPDNNDSYWLYEESGVETNIFNPVAVYNNGTNSSVNAWSGSTAIFKDLSDGDTIGEKIVFPAALTDGIRIRLYYLPEAFHMDEINRSIFSWFSPDNISKERKLLEVGSHTNNNVYFEYDDVAEEVTLYKEEDGVKTIIGTAIDVSADDELKLYLNIIKSTDYSINALINGNAVSGSMTGSENYVLSEIIANENYDEVEAFAIDTGTEQKIYQLFSTANENDLIRNKYKFSKKGVYYSGDLVDYKGRIYTCKADNTEKITPKGNYDNWELITASDTIDSREDYLAWLKYNAPMLVPYGVHKSFIAAISTLIFSGTADTNTTDYLSDSTADFSDVDIGDIVYNATDDTWATVITTGVTALELDWNAFPDGNEDYYIYNDVEWPENIVECDGSDIQDFESPANGRVLPDLNGSGLNAGQFLRGSGTAGTTQSHAHQSHSHSHRHSAGLSNTGSSGGPTFQATLPAHDSYNHNEYVGYSAAGASGTTAAETRPNNTAVVYVMRVK